MKQQIHHSIILALAITVSIFSSTTELYAQQQTESVYQSEFIGSFCRVQIHSQLYQRGAVYIGEVISDDGYELGIIDEYLGLVVLSKDQIASIEKLDSSGKDLANNGEPYIPKGAFTTRNIFTANAFHIEKGKHYAMLNLYGPEVHIAVNDHLNVGAISSWIGSPMALEAKFTLTDDDSKLKFAVGAIGGNGGYLTQFKYNTGLVWGTLTMGTRQNNVSLSGGYFAFQTQEMWVEPGVYLIDEYNRDWDLSWEEQIADLFDVQSRNLNYKSPVFSVAGALRVGRKTSLIFDSMFFPKIKSGTGSNTYYDYVYDENGDLSYEVQVTDVEDTGSRKLAVIMPGCRIQSTSNKAFQFSLAGIMYTDNYGNFIPIPIPMCSWFLGF